MEVVMFLGLIAAGVVALALALKASFWILAFVVLPLFWLWMLVDAIARKTEDYPSASTNEKILWIVLMIVVQVSAAVYWFMVWRPGRTRAAVPATEAPASPASPAPVSQGALVPTPPTMAPTSPPAV